MKTVEAGSGWALALDLHITSSRRGPPHLKSVGGITLGQDQICISAPTFFRLGLKVFVTVREGTLPSWEDLKVRLIKNISGF